MKEGSRRLRRKAHTAGSETVKIVADSGRG
jgi:hypothetical protein